MYKIKNKQEVTTGERDRDNKMEDKTKIMFNIMTSSLTHKIENNDYVRNVRTVLT